MNDTGFVMQDVYKIYKNGTKEVRAVNGVSLEVKKGGAVAIVGPSGAGKSTLLHLLGGLDEPTSGRITLDGIDIYRIPDRERARLRNEKVGFVFQFYHLLPEFTALENVMLPGLIKGYERRTTNDESFDRAQDSSREVPSGARGAKSRDERRNRAMDLLKSVGLEDRINHRPAELSGGESQRVAIARALVNRPDILLCDEPTGNLDSKMSESIYDLLLELKAKADMALVIVTHDEGISSKTEATIHIKDGKII